MMIFGLTSLKGCREGKASLLGEGVLGYAVSEEEELFIESRLQSSARSPNGTQCPAGLTILNAFREM